MNENFNAQNNPSYLERLMKPSEVAVREVLMRRILRGLLNDIQDDIRVIS